ncbi:helix-hairpin-helix domain-containing protein [uncultured Fibrobacter sp.]|uniref:ComEA family DNA-binding protein n=1 Tax=uncultured Fibrobacter sp. TaxID=261512 RepID=UPI0025E732FE|nr:helix-hairpin-helix domain-containing protein [uncultured Fibrobacter sp.]
MNILKKAMNASEKRILKLAIILFTIGLTVRYLPWGLPSIETFEVGDAIIVANAPPVASPAAVPDADTSAVPINDTDKVIALTDPGPKSTEHHRKAKKKVTLPLHINTASADDLCALKGVGPKLAEKIIEQRTASGPFKGPADLKKVHGIGKKKLENMLQSIIFD